MEKEWAYFYSGARRYLDRAKNSQGQLRENYLETAEGFKDLLKFNLDSYSHKFERQNLENKKLDLETLSVDIKKEFLSN
jgi:hypothetical protein